MYKITTKRLIFMVTFFILILHPCGALIADLIQNSEHNYFKDLSLTAYLFFTPFASVTPILFLGFSLILRENWDDRVAKVSIAIAAILMIGFSLFGQYYSFLKLGTDAQAGLIFGFLPLIMAAFYTLIAAIFLGIYTLSLRKINK